MKFKKSELTNFAKLAVFTNKTILDAICTSEDLFDEIGRYICNDNGDDEVENCNEVVYEVAKRYAKYAKETMRAEPKLNARTLDDAEEILGRIINCCEENNWFVQ